MHLSFTDYEDAMKTDTDCEPSAFGGDFQVSDHLASFPQALYLSSKSHVRDNLKILKQFPSQKEYKFPLIVYVCNGYGQKFKKQFHIRLTNKE